MSELGVPVLVQRAHVYWGAGDVLPVDLELEMVNAGLNPTWEQQRYELKRKGVKVDD